MDPIIGGAIIKGGLDLASQAASGGMSRRKAGRQFKHNQKLAEYSFDRQYEMWDEAWNRETEYNDPSAQMGRLKKAGINPHMAYANGSGSNTAQTAGLPQYNQETNDVGGNSKIDLGGVVNSYFRTQQMDADLRTKKAKATQEEVQADISKTNLADKLGAEYHKNAGQYQKALQDMDLYTGQKGKQSQYQRRASAQTSIQEMQLAVSKADKYLKEVTASNLITNDEMIEMQSKILNSQWELIESPTFKKMPTAAKAAIIGLMSRLGANVK